MYSGGHIDLVHNAAELAPVIDIFLHLSANGPEPGTSSYPYFDFLALAGAVRVPAAKRNAAWDDVIRRTRLNRAAARR
ncbi:hypothetical protein AWC06_11680 [Mycobacterium fragae]|uniref:Uncharacterized protein n=1 Tax=Mycobacterium fragae TaxID=1260918 RepID=A0A1X1UZ89_9MYCO|nr:hypothetical protein AWC06_11680 [Mycobacterium fragae]